ncbi:MAG: glycosyltransferase [Cyanobacteria bacterium P01_D01_bin.156]
MEPIRFQNLSAMRVLFNTFPVAFDCPGGGEIQLLKCQEALVKQGVEVVFYDLWQPQFDQVDVVHYFSVQGGSANFCDYVHRRGMPLLISPILWITQESYDAGIYPVGEINHLLHLADRLLPNSQAEAAALSTIFNVPLEKFAPIVNGVDDYFLKGNANPDLFCQTHNIQAPFLLNVANIEPRKNQLNLVRAVRELDIPLMVLGNIRDRAYYDECVAEGDGCFNYLGYVEHHSPMLLSAYAACAAFVLPSTLETPGLAALEAAAMGARVVITQEGCTQEYFGDAVTYVDPHSVDSIRAGICQQLEGVSPVGLNAKVANSFTWERAAQQLSQAYQHAVRGKS